MSLLMAARTNRGTKDSPWAERVRAKIQTSMLVNRLIDHVLGTVELSATQVTSAKILIDKVLPSLTSSENTTTIFHASELRDDDLAAIAARGGADAVAERKLN
jgi:hypothetical protein